MKLFAVVNFFWVAKCFFASGDLVVALFEDDYEWYNATVVQDLQVWLSKKPQIQWLQAHSNLKSRVLGRTKAIAGLLFVGMILMEGLNFLFALQSTSGLLPAW